MKQIVPPWLAALLFAVGLPANADGGADCRSAGQCLYELGVDGEPTVAGDVVLQQHTCGGCHRKSALGTAEGEVGVPPIAGYFLTNTVPAPAYFTELMRSRHRLDYSAVSFHKLLTQGLRPDGSPVGNLMPKYAHLTRQQTKAIYDYLAGQTIVDAGVDAETVHLAVVSEAGRPGTDALWNTLSAFVRDKNSGTRGEQTRRHNSPWNMDWRYGSYRRWHLIHWQLQGAASGWGEQLQGLYKDQPVFAVIGGNVGDWRSVAGFCNTSEVPCLFPSTDIPAEAPGFYDVYFNRGLRLEQMIVASTGALVHHVVDPALDTAGFVRQMVGDLPSGPDCRDTMVWTRDPALVLRMAGGMEGTLWVSGTLLDDGQLDQLAGSLEQRLTIVYPRELPPRRARKTMRSVIWLSRKGIEPHPLALDAYFNASVVADAFRHMVNLFSREYFLERVEHMTENALVQPNYPSISLGPDQRFASKSGYLIDGARWASGDLGDLESVVPDAMPIAAAAPHR